MKPTGMFERVHMLERRIDRLEAVILRQDEELRALRTSAPERAPEAMEPNSKRMHDIAAEVAADNGLTMAELRSAAKSVDIAHPRQYAMMLMVDAGHSQAAVARFFGKDHTTVMHGVKAARARMSASCQ